MRSREPTFTASHLVIDPETREAAVIDPVLDFDLKSARTSTGFADEILAALTAEGARLTWILETHAHADHLTAAAYLKQKTTAKMAIDADITRVQSVFKPIFNATEMPIDGSQFDHLLKAREHLSIGHLTAEVIATPGHTPACVSYRIEDTIFVGDTLFMPD